MFFNDTVAYVHSKTKDIVERQLNKDLKNMSIYFKTNHSMIFGTSSTLSKCNKKLTLYYDDRVIHASETFKYLGTILDSSLSCSTNLVRMHKKITSKRDNFGQ